VSLSPQAGVLAYSLASGAEKKAPKKEKAK